MAKKLPVLHLHVHILLWQVSPYVNQFNFYVLQGGRRGTPSLLRNWTSKIIFGGPISRGNFLTKPGMGWEGGGNNKKPLRTEHINSFEKSQFDQAAWNHLSNILPSLGHKILLFTIKSKLYTWVLYKFHPFALWAALKILLPKCKDSIQDYIFLIFSQHIHL